MQEDEEEEDETMHLFQQIGPGARSIIRCIPRAPLLFLYAFCHSLLICHYDLLILLTRTYTCYTRSNVPALFFFFGHFFFVSLFLTLTFFLFLVFFFRFCLPVIS